METLHCGKFVSTSIVALCLCSALGCAATAGDDGPGEDFGRATLQLVWSESSAEPVIVQVHRDVLRGDPPAEYTNELGVRFVRRDLATELPKEISEDSRSEEERYAYVPEVPPTTDDRTVEQIADDERIVVFVSGTEYISDPDFEGARRIKDGEDSLMERTSAPAPESVGTEDAEEWRDRALMGPDDRYSLDSVAHVYPDHTHVNYDRPEDNSHDCTAVQIGKFTLASCAHCLHSGGSFYTPIHNLFGGQSSAGPFWSLFRGSTTSACWTYSVKSGWDGDDHEYDYSTFDLRGCPQVPSGWLGVATTAGWDQTHYVNGYPLPDPNGNSGRLWGENGATAFSSSTWFPEYFFHRQDATGGQSGAGIYRKSGSNRYVVATHIGWMNPVIHNSANYGRDVDTTVFNFYKSAGGLCQTPGFETCN